MSDVRIPWTPRVLLGGRTFRLPVQADGPEVDLVAEDFLVVSSRWSGRDSATYFYLQAPDRGGDFRVKAYRRGRETEATIQVRTLDDLRQPHTFNGAVWPRRWPLGERFASTKTRQTLQESPRRREPDPTTMEWWMGLSDEMIWRQLAPTEIPRAHFTNCHQGCPKCGTELFRYSGFYPWKRNHRPCDFRSTCPCCGSTFPSNDLAAGDFTSGEYADDGYGYFDAEGHIYLFAATYARDQISAFTGGIGALATSLRGGRFDQEVARKLGVMLLRYAVEACYLAAVPQFRWGPSKGVEDPWDWGQPDWATKPDPLAAIRRMGEVHYSISTPGIAQGLAYAYDTAWPLIREDVELVRRAQALGLPVRTPAETVGLIEEMLACQLQCILDRGASTNLPGESLGALALVRALDRADAGGVMDWVFDEGPDALRVFATNDFFPDGTPQEATGGYNSIHSNGLFDLEHQLRELRELHPKAYPASRYPSMMSDPRMRRVPLALQEITMVGKSYFQYGDGGAPGSGATHDSETAMRSGSIRLGPDCFHAPMSGALLDRAAAFTGDPLIEEIRDTVKAKRHRAIGSTVHDGVGIAILRTSEAPERAALGIVYGDSLHHRHRDLLDVQLFAFERPFLTDLGYPQSWASASVWEAHWATHNTVWGALEPGASPGAGRGRLVRSMFAEGVQVLEVEAERWGSDAATGGWRKLGVTYRRLLALVETDEQGVAVIDLSRVRGGVEHWRVCRGLEGEFEAAGVGLRPRGGTVADPDGKRGDTSRLSHPDHTAFAYMDEVACAPAPASFKGGWRSRREPAAQLDLHQLRVTPGAELMTARETATMGKPEESTYCYRTALWRRRPAGDADVTAVDLILEPRVGEATLADTRAFAGSMPEAVGVALTTCAGRTVSIYWSPGAGLGEETVFEDGARLRGVLAVVRGGRVSATGASAFEADGRSHRFEGARLEGRIVGLDRAACTVDVEGISGIQSGDRVLINPEGRGHTYRVEGVGDMGGGKLRLRLDVSSVLGRGRLVSSADGRLSLDFFILARSGNLHATRVQAEPDGVWAEILDAWNAAGPPASEWRTGLSLRGDVGDSRRLLTMAPGTWMQVVDYVHGDRVVFEPLRMA